MAYDFDSIATRYDRLNHIMTGSLDKRWRRKAAKAVAGHSSHRHLDVATGTGDLAYEIIRQTHGKTAVTGVDLSEKMLSIAQHKIPQATLQIANAEQLPFTSNFFDSVSVAFGIRNFVHLDKGLAEMARVLRPGGLMIILELSTPDNAIVRSFYNLYAHLVIPCLGQLVAGNREAYKYLARSIDNFPKGEAMVDRLCAAGIEVEQKKFLFGTCRMYTGIKK